MVNLVLRELINGLVGRIDLCCCVAIDLLGTFIILLYYFLVFFSFFLWTFER